MCMITALSPAPASAPEATTVSVTPAPRKSKTLSKRVSFSTESDEVFAVERLDACLVEELFYNAQDFHRFRLERRQTPTQPKRQRRTLSARATSVRREKFQQLVKQRTVVKTPEATNAQLLCESSLEAANHRHTVSSLRRMRLSVSPRGSATERDALQSMRTHMSQ